MNIKSMLLGSAAALVAVTGARAADAVVMVEPEPMEYVRVCDVYGTGFFYIPGTETCLKISGYVRARVYAGTNDGVFNTDLEEFGEDYSTNTEIRARLDFDAREETELGTLRAKIRVQATNDGNGFATGDRQFGMDEGFIQLGGLTVGYLDTLWTDGDGLLLDNDWAAGDRQQNRISYTYAASGFSATVSLEDDGTGDFVPDVVAKLAYEGGFGGAYITGVFDEQQFDSAFGNYDGGRFGFNGLGQADFADVFTNDYTPDDGAFALKAGITLENLIAEDSTFKIEGHYAFDPTAYAIVEYVTGDNYGLGGSSGLDNIPSEFQIGAAYTQQFGKLFAGINGVYGQTFDLDVDYGFNQGFFLDLDGAEYYGAAVNVGYDITSNLSVLGEISYVDIDTPDGLDDYDQTAGFVELLRRF